MLERSVSGGEHEIYVVSHGWHTGFVVPAVDIQLSIPALKTRFGYSEYLELGWGDRGFYQTSEITSGLTLRAIFWPTESVIHAVSVPANIKKYFSYSDVETLCLNDDEYASLIRFISNSFARNNSGEVLPQKRGIYGNSQFYTGVGDYYLMNTCNKWTAKGLKSAGLAIAPMFKLTASSVMNSLNNRDTVQTKHCTRLKR